MNQEYILALDIGTRTVVGLLCRLTEKGEVLVEHSQVEWHPQRAMLDGQIHDVAQVSAVLARVKEVLEEKGAVPLQGAAIAAAGRALTTIRVKEKIDLALPREIEPEDVEQLEIKALTKAREEMAQKSPSLYCVGLSPVAYCLDDAVIANPVGQRGNSIGIEIIATFLPRMVVDSLLAAVTKAGLQVDSLTLEPIAAMAVAVPPPLRLLNIALVDIGAGTSDIAVSREGTIVAYGMVDMAGDEVTEAIAQEYLLDFNSAERVKLRLGSEEAVGFTDVLGNTCLLDRDEILAVIKPVVDKLAAALAAEIRRCNGGSSPAALFCAGGGSLTPFLREDLARHLGLPLERVGIRTGEQLEGVRFLGRGLQGPEIITPLGIALMAARPRQEFFLRLVINGQEVTLFNLQKATVAQALLHSGLGPAEDFTSSGEFELNGRPRTIARGSGWAARILVNDAPAPLDTPLASGDRVTVLPGEREEAPPPPLLLSELAESLDLPSFVINGGAVEFPLLYKINGLSRSPDTPVEPGDKVEIRPPKDLSELALLMDLDLCQVAVTVDGNRAGPDTVLASGASITIGPLPPAVGGEILVSVNGASLALPPERSILAYALAKADIQQVGTEGGDLVVTVNGVPGEYTAPLKSGDRIQVYWAPKA